MTRLFGKKDDKTTIAELEEYYSNQNQKKNRTGTAWLMAIFSILITVAVIVLLFLAGRWVYRAVTDNNENDITTSESSGIDIDLPNFGGDVVGQGNSSSDSNSESSDSSPSENTGTVSDSAASTSESNADRVAENNNDSTQTTLNTNDTITNTGPGEVLLVVPVATAVAGYLFSRRRQIKTNI